jgi:exodeoxyribonuclease VII small subunit
VTTSWSDAIAELESILVALDDDKLDVDALSSKVARAAELIALCRDRIAGTKLEVERIVADLDASGSAAPES